MEAGDYSRNPCGKDECVTDEPVELKVKELTPQTKSVNLTIRVVKMGEPEAVPARGGGVRHVTEAVVGDETASIIMSLWEKQAEGITENAVLRIENGYISLVRGHMRLNVGKYGRMSSSNESIPEVNEEENLSEADHSTSRSSELGEAVDLRRRKGPWASTGYGMDDERRTRGRSRRHRDDYDRYY
jgi:replication factor A1